MNDVARLDRLGNRVIAHFSFVGDRVQYLRQLAQRDIKAKERFEQALYSAQRHPTNRVQPTYIAHEPYAEHVLTDDGFR